LFFSSIGGILDCDYGCRTDCFAPDQDRSKKLTHLSWRGSASGGAIMRIFDLDQLDDDSSLDADLCIVGSGPAGISIAAEFAKTHLNVLVLESGGVDDEPDTQALYKIESTGAPRILDQWNLRRRILGGSSHVWTGRCAPFDEIDFERRPWISHSGWPINRKDLSEHQRRAAGNLGLAARGYDESLWSLLEARSPATALDPQLLEPRFWQFSKSPTYQTQAAHFGVDLFKSGTAENVKALLHANLTHINVSPDGRRFESAEVTSLAGKRVIVRSKALVLCCGGIENARLLLASDRQMPAGVGNEHDKVGRFLMDHTSGAIGQFHPANAIATRSRFGHYWLDDENGRHVYLHGLALSRQMQISQGLLNCHAFIEESYAADGDAWAAVRRLKSAAQSRNPGAMLVEARAALAGSDDIARAAYRRLIKHRPALGKTERVEMHCILEQAPDPNSRISLSKERDATGLPLSQIDWKKSELEQRTIAAIAKCICSEFSRIGLAAPRIESWLAAGGWTEHCIEKAHPTGSTRMSLNPKDGVVDVNCQVHNVDGLFIAGSSVFPTSGAANPTLMIVAMALRLADWLKNSYFAGEVAQRPYHASAPSGRSSRPRATKPSIKIGIVGAGHRVRDYYLPILRELSDQYEVVGFTTRSQRSAQRLEGETGVSSFREAHDLIEHKKPDLLVVAVQDKHNERTVIDLIECGIPILAETPLAWTGAGVRRIIEKAKAHKVTVGVAEQFPFLPLEQFRRQLIERDVFGEIYAALNDFHSYSYHGIAQLRRYLRGRPEMVQSIEHPLPRSRRWQTGSVEFDDGATLFHNYAISELSTFNSVRLYGRSAVMSDYEIELLGEKELRNRVVAKRELTVTGALKSISADIPGRGVIEWANPFASHHFSDDQVAVATVLNGMANVLPNGAAPLYTCEDFLVDIEIIRAFSFSAKRGGARISLPLNEKQQALRLFANSSFWIKKLIGEKRKSAGVEP
jgi:choline dehydrogenase-like flavoprotein/predicted dehydrogenase